MAFESVIIFFTLVLGALALPAPNPESQSSFQDGARNSRIVGGTQAAVGAHPHMVAISTGRLLRYCKCGGSIIGRRSVLTAAHCIDGSYDSGSLSDSLKIIVGTNNCMRGGEVYSVASNLTYPEYENYNFTHDITILYTSTPISYSDLVQPIALNFDFIDAGVIAKVAGWGLTREEGRASRWLLEITVSTVDSERCVTEVAQAGIENGYEALPPVLPDIELCTIHAKGDGYGTCSGDSGSPLVDLATNRQIGLVTWGIPCGLGVPDMFARISAYENWLTEHLLD